MKSWGLMPDNVREILRKTEWENSANLTKRLLGERSFPVTINLKPPSGQKALEDLPAFHAFIKAWQAWPNKAQVSWKVTQYTQLGEVSVPTHCTLNRIQELFQIIGDEAVARSECWQQRMTPILKVDQCLYSVLVKYLKKLESLSQLEAQMVGRLLPQLKKGMGNGCYLRALPIVGIDTKFVETHLPFISALLDGLYEGAIQNSGGIMAWLDCNATPSDWLLVMPLCPETTRALGGVRLLKVPTEALRSTPLPGERLLVVENYQSGYSLPKIASTVAVVGGGGNLAWTDGLWLKDRSIGYWGDMDTWGFSFLSEARRRQTHVKSLLMDEATLLQHREHLVEEPEPFSGFPEHLTEAEGQVFQALRNGRYGNGRLEQERLASDFIRCALEKW